MAERHTLSRLNVSGRVWAHLILLSGLIVACLVAPAPGVAAQSGTPSDPYEAALLDWSISVSGPNYVLEDVSLEEYPHGKGERIYITSVDSLGFAEVSLFDDADSPDQTMEIVLRDFESASSDFALLDSGGTNGVYYALARFEIDGTLTGYFYIEIAPDIDGNVDFVQSIYSLNSDFLTQVSIAREEIDLNGLAFLAQPAIDLNAAIAADEAMIESTPAATPEPDQFQFDSGPAQLSVNPPVKFDFPYMSGPLDLRFLKTEHAFGVVGYILQEADQAEAVLGTIFIDAPTGASAPMELLVEADADHALGVYQIETEGETRLMVIEIDKVEDDLWLVQALAAEQIVFANEFVSYQDSVTIDSIPMLNNIDPEDVLSLVK